MNTYSPFFLFTCALSSIIMLITYVNDKASLNNKTSKRQFSIFETYKYQVACLTSVLLRAILRSEYLCNVRSEYSGNP
jgi:hypothetical protein